MQGTGASDRGMGRGVGRGVARGVAQGGDGMAFFDWIDELSVGNQRMDEQHKGLIHLINRLHEGVVDGQGPDLTGGVLAELLGYTKKHFRAEEALLARVEYPHLDLQRSEHRAFELKVNAMLADHQRGNQLIHFEILGFLKRWLTAHIIEQDTAYTTYVSQ